MGPKSIDKQARRMCTHTVVFTDALQIDVVTRAMQGLSTKRIADEFGITESRVQYMIGKAQRTLNTYFRNDYRSGQGATVLRMLQATRAIAATVIREEIAPKWTPFAAQGVPRHPSTNTLTRQKGTLGNVRKIAA